MKWNFLVLFAEYITSQWDNLHSWKAPHRDFDCRRASETFGGVDRERHPLHKAFVSSSLSHFLFVNEKWFNFLENESIKKIFFFFFFVFSSVFDFAILNRTSGMKLFLLPPSNSSLRMSFIAERFDNEITEVYLTFNYLLLSSFAEFSRF